jgi:hypothetical protein
MMNSKICSWVMICMMLAGAVLELPGQEDSGRRKKKSKGSKEKSRLEQFAGEEDEDDEDSGSCVGNFFTDLLLHAGWEFTKFLLFSPSVDSTRFLAYPYAGGQPGISMAQKSSIRFRSGFGQVQAAYHYIDHDLTGFLFTARGRFNDIAGLNFQCGLYREDRVNQDDVDLVMLRLGLMINLLVYENMIWDLDLGGRVIESSGGVDLGTRLQLFPKPPYSLDIWATLGGLNERFFLEFKPMAGFLIWRIQLDAGFRYMKWGHESLHGPVAGLRIWF